MKFNLIKMLTIGLLPSSLKIVYYRLRGAEIAKDVHIGLFSIINANNIKIAQGTRISILCSITGKTVRIGKRVNISMAFVADCRELYIGNDSSIGESVLVGAMPTPQSKLIIGQRVNILPFCIFNPSRTIFIGNNTGIGSHVSILTHASSLSVFEGFPVMFGNVMIENNAWISWNVTITLNTSIGRNSIVNAGSLVSSAIPRGAIVSGVPAKEIVTGGAYIRKSALKNGEKILRKVVDDLVALLTDDDNWVSRFNGKQVYGLDFKCQGKITRLRIPVSKSVQQEDADIWISLDKLTDGEIALLTERSIAWFDIKTKRTGGLESACWKYMRDFLFRYGVRFRVLD